MLGLLMMAGLGLAATALMEHVDDHPADAEHHDETDGANASAHGSLLDDPDMSHSVSHSTEPDHVQPVVADHTQDNPFDRIPAGVPTTQEDFNAPFSSHHAGSFHHAPAQQGQDHPQPVAHHVSGHQVSDHQTLSQPAQSAHHQPAHHQPEYQPISHHLTAHHTSGQQATVHHPSAHPAATHHASPAQNPAQLPPQQPSADGHTAHAAHTLHPPSATAHESSVSTSHDATTGLSKLFGGEGNDTLNGSTHNDLIEGNGGDDKLLGHAGNDHLVGFDAGRDTLYGNEGDDTLHGYMVQHQPGNLSYVVEDHQSDHLYGGLGNDKLYLASDDVGAGGAGKDEFHVSWDVERGHPAQITDYNPRQDKIYVEFTSNHADADMTEAKPGEMHVTTGPMKDGAGTSILVNGEPVADVLGALNLHPSDIGLIHA